MVIHMVDYLYNHPGKYEPRKQLYNRCWHYLYEVDASTGTIVPRRKVAKNKAFNGLFDFSGGDNAG